MIGVSRRQIWPGSPVPLGASWDGHGTNFALFSINAEKVELCLFDTTGRKEIERIELPEYSKDVWHGYLPEVGPGTLYGYRVYGAYDPKCGHRFNHHKLLVDPYAKALSGQPIHHASHYADQKNSPYKNLSFDTRDNARYMPKAIVCDMSFDWGNDTRPDIPWQESIIYEAHVKGLTMLHPSVPKPYRGTFSGLAYPTVIQHLKALGITAIELLPIHAFADECHLANFGLANYWGYNSYCYFAADSRYLSMGHPNEFRAMVQCLHAANIEVILDVVYNHTAEGNHLGPTFNFKGIDNSVYYRLVSGREHLYENYSGCGNTLDLSHPRVLQMVIDSLRYWVEEMHVDGFRFDLGAALSRDAQGHFDSNSAFLSTIRQDSVLSSVKMIAESWDMGPDSYHMGDFPSGWSEWNDKYRDCIRSFWIGHSNGVAEIASRLTGSSDLFEAHGRQPCASINFVTAHDGFTLQDLVSFNEKHNEANGEANRDGSENNLSWNCGVEGPTTKKSINQLRQRQKRNLMATLLLSQGTPMLAAGDEMGRTQLGNNNAYCQDNEISWIHWGKLGSKENDFLAFIKDIIALRRDYPIFHRSQFFHGKPIGETQIKDITWLSSEGRELYQDEWRLDFIHCFGFHIRSSPEDQDYVLYTDRDQPEQRFIMLLNAYHAMIPFCLPSVDFGRQWQLLFDTAQPDCGALKNIYFANQPYLLQDRSIAVFMWIPETTGE